MEKYQVTVIFLTSSYFWFYILLYYTYSYPYPHHKYVPRVLAFLLLHFYYYTAYHLPSPSSSPSPSVEWNVSECFYFSRNLILLFLSFEIHFSFFFRSNLHINVWTFLSPFWVFELVWSISWYHTVLDGRATVKFKPQTTRFSCGFACDGMEGHDVLVHTYLNTTLRFGNGETSFWKTVKWISFSDPSFPISVVNRINAAHQSTEFQWIPVFPTLTTRISLKHSNVSCKHPSHIGIGFMNEWLSDGEWMEGYQSVLFFKHFLINKKSISHFIRLLCTASQAQSSHEWWMYVRVNEWR